MMRIITLLAVLLLAQAPFLTGCGGGSSSAGPPVVQPPPEESTPVGGLDERPANLTCVAPNRREPDRAVAIERAFPALEFQQPLYLGQAPDDATRWFVLEKGGRVRVFENEANVAVTSVFLDLSAAVVTTSEGGLLGLAFAPDFAATGTAYVSYTRSRPSDGAMQSVVSRFTSPDLGLTLEPGSEEVLLTIEQPFANHNGGGIAFGPDGYLYLGMGDGGSGGDPLDNGQTTTNLLGTFIRIDVSGNSGYAIPTDNPFAGNPLCSLGTGSADCPEIFAWGLRNPWRWSFDRSTGLLWAGDVGQNRREEVNVVQRGGNYGWRYREGFLCFNPSTDCPSAGLEDPVIDYPHSIGNSITGGYVYRGELLPQLRGRYVFGDFGRGLVWMLDSDVDGNYIMRELAATGLSISSFGEGNDGELYVVDIGGGLYQLRPAAAGASDAVPMELSATGCVDPANPTLPAAGLIPYRPGAPFWSDGATKDRWLALPEGTSVAVAADGDFNFPAGSVLVKNFSLHDRLVETRLFMRHPDGVWAGYTYQWNEVQDEAYRVTGGATVEIGPQQWLFPSEAQCMQCHTSAAGRSLGLEVAQLNNAFRYAQTGREANQLLTLDEIRLLAPPLATDPVGLPALPDPFGQTSLADRARAYLHTNCANCHRPGGPTPSDMDWRYGLPLAQTGSCNVPPTTGGTLDIPGALLLNPGDPDRSLVWVRMGRRDVHAMPPVGSLKADPEGLTLIREWISGVEMEACLDAGFGDPN